MADHPILFSAPMVRALLDGRKTQTRRIMKVQPPEWASYCEQPEMLNVLGKWVPSGLWRWCEPERIASGPLREWPVDQEGRHYWLRPPFAPGDRLWVKETWRTHRAFDDYRPGLIGTEARVWYEADERDNCDQHGKTRVSIFMPRWASRLTLTVTDVRVERLQDCSEADALAEGVHVVTIGEVRHMLAEGVDLSDDEVFYAAPGDDSEDCLKPTAVDAYSRLWDSINGEGAWAENPWIVAVTFTTERRNIDAA